MQLGTLPLHIHFISTGHIAFTMSSKFSTIFDCPESGIEAIIDEEGIKIINKELGEEEDFPYNELIQWQENNNLLSWLKQQQLQMPRFEI